MHLAPSHAVLDLPTLHAFIKQHPLGLITTSLPSENYPTLQSSHIPWVLEGEAWALPEHDKDKSSQSLGILRGHITLKNPQGAAMVEALNTTPVIPGAFPGDETTAPEAGEILPGEVLIVFTSPVDHYISANLYTEKRPSGRVAPTWNYAAVQVYGRARIYHTKSSEKETFLRRQLDDLAKLGEEGIMGFKDSEVTSGLDSPAEINGLEQGKNANGSAPLAWKVADAPPDYIAALLTKIIGMRIEITRIEGRFKVSQEKGSGDRSGVVEGLEGMGPIARNMAEFVKMGGLGLS